MNMGTILVCLILLGAVSLAVRTLVRDRRQGKHVCGGNCAQCHGCSHGR